MTRWSEWKDAEYRCQSPVEDGEPVIVETEWNVEVNTTITLGWGDSGVYPIGDILRYKELEEASE